MPHHAINDEHILAVPEANSYDIDELINALAWSSHRQCSRCSDLFQKAKHFELCGFCADKLIRQKDYLIDRLLEAAEVGKFSIWNHSLEKAFLKRMISSSAYPAWCKTARIKRQDALMLAEAENTRLVFVNTQNASSAAYSFAQILFNGYLNNLYKADGRYNLFKKGVLNPSSIPSTENSKTIPTEVSAQSALPKSPKPFINLDDFEPDNILKLIREQSSQTITPHLKDRTRYVNKVIFAIAWRIEELQGVEAKCSVVWNVLKVLSAEYPRKWPDEDERLSAHDDKFKIYWKPSTGKPILFDIDNCRENLDDWNKRRKTIASKQIASTEDMTQSPA